MILDHDPGLPFCLNMLAALLCVGHAHLHQCDNSRQECSAQRCETPVLPLCDLGHFLQIGHGGHLYCHRLGATQLGYFWTLIQYTLRLVSLKTNNN